MSQLWSSWVYCSVFANQSFEISPAPPTSLRAKREPSSAGFEKQQTIVMMVFSWLKPGVRLERKDEPQSQSGRPSEVSRAMDSRRPTPICTASHEVQRRLGGIHFGEREQVVAGKWSVKRDIDKVRNGIAAEAPSSRLGTRNENSVKGADWTVGGNILQ
jgi:hypothetical protein